MTKSGTVIQAVKKHVSIGVSHEFILKERGPSVPKIVGIPYMPAQYEKQRPQMPTRDLFAVANLVHIMIITLSVNHVSLVCQ